MPNLAEPQLSRKRIGVRLLYTILFAVILDVAKMIIQLITVFQFIYLLITRQYSEPARRFANRLSAYTYRVMRYLTLNDNTRPFPFQEFPSEMEAPVEKVSFD